MLRVIFIRNTLNFIRKSFKCLIQRFSEDVEKLNYYSNILLNILLSKTFNKFSTLQILQTRFLLISPKFQNNPFHFLRFKNRKIQIELIENQTPFPPRIKLGSEERRSKKERKEAGSKTAGREERGRREGKKAADR